MNVGELKAYIEVHRIPDDAPVMSAGSDHSRYEIGQGQLEDTVIKEGPRHFSEDFGEDVTDHGKRIKALVIR